MAIAGALVACTGKPHATVFTARGELDEEQEREWFEYQRTSRAGWDPQVRACLSAAVPQAPEPPAPDFWPRAHRTLQSAPRAMQDCKKLSGLTSLSGTLTLAVEFSPQGDVSAVGVVRERTTSRDKVFHECLRRRFCFLKAWPAQATTIGEFEIDTSKIQ